MPLYFRTGVGPIRYSTRISGGRRRSRGSSGGGSGCAAVIGFVLLVAAVFWPFIYLHGALKWVVGIIWLAVLAGLGVLLIVGYSAQQKEKKQQAEREQAEAQSARLRRQEEVRRQEIAALERAKRTGWLELHDGEVLAYHGMTPAGQACHHRHRTPETAVACATRLQRQERW